MNGGRQGCRPVRLPVCRTWNGDALGPEEIVHVEFGREEGHLLVRVNAPFHGDAPPPVPSGSVDRLWDYEVVELFLLGGESRYLEIELGPHGHYLVLQLQGERRVVQKGLPIHYDAQIFGRQWRGAARIPLSYLPAGVNRANAYAIHGIDRHRRYLAAFPTGGGAPDFHKLKTFKTIVW